MAECDGFFDAEGIPFKPEYEDAAVRAVRAADFFDPYYKKWLIICWFDTTFGSWDGTRYDTNNSRSEMARYLTASNYSSYEAMLSDPAEPQ